MTSRRHVLAIDQGTTGTTVLVLGAEGELRGRGYAELAQIYPRPGWVEHDPEAIWDTVTIALGRALADAGVQGAEVAAVGIANQRETALVWERRSGQPIHRAIVWQCRRTAPECERLRAEGAEPEIRAHTGLVIDPYFSGTKIRWLLDAVPGARARAERGDLAFGTVDTWLLWRLTKGAVHATDPSNASRTLCFDIHRLAWDDSLCRLLRVPMAVLPRVLPSAGAFGEIAGGGPLPGGVPVTGIAGDQQAALFGQTCFAAGAAKNTYGTGCFVLLNTGQRPVMSRLGLLTTVAWSIGGHMTYALEGSVFVAGAAVQWLRDGLGIIASAEETQSLAESVPDTGGVYLVPAFVGLGAPHWDPYARGAIVGLTRGTTRAHLARAALEAIAFQSRDVLDIMTREGGVPLAALRVDGGAARNDFLCQFQADILGLPVLRPAVTETTALGAGYLAGLGARLWTLEDLATRWKLGRSFEPSLGEPAREEAQAGWRRAVERALAWARVEPS